MRSSVELWLKMFRVHLHHFSDHRCDISPPDIKEYFFVTSCAKEVRCYLREVKMSETTVSTENVLIFAPTGLFSDDVATRTICLRHRAELGLMWRPRRKCAHPLRGTKNKTKKQQQQQPEMGAGLPISNYIKTTWNVLVPAGADKNLSSA